MNNQECYFNDKDNYKVDRNIRVSILCPLYYNLYEKLIDKIKSCMGKWPHSKANALSPIHPPPLCAKELDSS